MTQGDEEVWRMTGRVDPKPTPAASGDVEAAWWALLDCSDDSHGDSEGADIQHHRPLIEAAIRAEAATPPASETPNLDAMRAAESAVRAAAGREIEGAQVVCDLWDGQRLVIGVSDSDPGDIGEPRDVYADGVHYVTVAAIRVHAPRGHLVQGEPGLHDDEPQWSDDELAEWRSVLNSSGAPLKPRARKADR